MTAANRQRAIQEIDRRAIIERGIDLNTITCFNRRLARFAALLPPGEAPNFDDRLTKMELRQWVETEREFRGWLNLNKLT